MSEQPERDQSLRRTRPCPICGGLDFRWGTVGTGGIGPMFNEDETPPGFFSRRRTVELVARECALCGNVQWFTKK